MILGSGVVLVPSVGRRRLHQLQMRKNTHQSHSVKVLEIIITRGEIKVDYFLKVPITLHSSIQYESFHLPRQIQTTRHKMTNAVTTSEATAL
jgi:hypothetical protein